MKYLKYYGLALFIIALDQAVKMLVHFNMEPGMMGEIPVFGQWFKLHYTINPGMAFGVELGLTYGKLVLTLFRLAALSGLFWLLNRLIQRNAKTGLLVCLSLVLAGAFGNVIDSIFYGVLLNNAPYDAPSPWFHGQVIDMFFLDIYDGELPSWIPFMGGTHVSLWPIFNVADASIFTGIATLLVFRNTLLIDLTDVTNKPADPITSNTGIDGLPREQNEPGNFRAAGSEETAVPGPVQSSNEE
ncbi:MAG: lipoprotein signal peptidase [Bacteroidota bacterium]